MGREVLASGSFEGSLRRRLAVGTEVSGQMLGLGDTGPICLNIVMGLN